MRLATELVRRGSAATVFSRLPVQSNPESLEIAARGVKGDTPISVAARVTHAILGGDFTDVIIQYTPQMWGASRFGSPAIVGLAATLRAAGRRIHLIAHELSIPWSGRPDLAAGAAMQRMQVVALMKASDSIFVTTESRREVAARLSRLGRAHAPPLLLPVGPNALPSFPPASSRRRARVGLFSTLARGKRFDVVISAFEAIQAEIPDAELLILGDLGGAEGGQARALQERVRGSRAAARISFSGNLPLSEIARIVSTLDLYFFPMDTGANTRSGTLPLALGSGLAVVATRGSETDPALFHDGENVLFADEMSATSFARAGLRVLQDPRLAEQLRKGARALYERELSWELIGDRFLEGIK
jgi:glycosyltransferase involved in cell wall biosynthesis